MPKRAATAGLPRPTRDRVSALTLLRRLTATRLDYGPGAAERKLDLLVQLARARLPEAGAVVELHERLLFLRAYPDDARVLAAAERLLQGFARRADAGRWRSQLADSGIAGTLLRYPFFYPTAAWLARRFPARLRLDWESTGDPAELLALLVEILPAGEAVWLRERRPAPRQALAALAGPSGSDAGFLLERLAALPGDDFTREARHDRVSPWYALRPGPGTPSRTLARDPEAGVVFRQAPLARVRPDLAAELARPPQRVVEVTGGAARALVTLAREAMVTRARDLDCFCYGDARDVRRIVDHDGLELIAIGSLPERRLLLAAAYGLLVLRNGVPTGYVQLDAFLWTALVHFNTFDTFRGADAAWVFGRVLAAARALFGVDSFAIEPYQLGKGNDEALDSGAWWFYAKLGFRPRARDGLALARREFARLARLKTHRTPPETLRALAEHHLFLDLDARDPAPLVTPAAIGLAAARHLTRLAGSDRTAAVARASAESLKRCGLSSLGGFTAEECRAWNAWAPVLSMLPLAQWSAAEREQMVRIVRAKGEDSERNYVRAFAALPRLERALGRLAVRRSG